MKKVLIFGSTGSVGKNALSVIRRDKKRFKVLGLCANKDIGTLYRQIEEFKPLYVCVKDEEKAKKIRPKLTKRVKFFMGQEGLEEFSALKSDISLMAITGISSLVPLLINIKHTKRVALANKESVVVAGSLVFKQAKRFNTQILPVDSEINALFQLIGKNNFGDKPLRSSLHKIYLTASGGALGGYARKDLANVSVSKVLSHPTWRMGQRITIDSATLVNKAFEVIEAHYFFGLDFEKIGIVIHKESNIHALVEFCDSCLSACLYPPDMKIPIAFSLYYPDRHVSKKKNNFSGPFSYSFKPFCDKDYPLFKIILEAAKRKDNSLAVLNACDEVAIDYFLKKKIKFTDIHKAMKHVFSLYPSKKIKSIEDVFFWDNWSRIKTKKYLGNS